MDHGGLEVITVSEVAATAVATAVANLAILGSGV